MKASELIRVLMEAPHDAEIRIGDQIESGPYLHASVGGAWRGKLGAIILCAADDEVWEDEAAAERTVEQIWKP